MAETGVGTNLNVTYGSVDISLTDSAGMATEARCATANIPSAVAGYAVGCGLTDTTTGIRYINTGSTSSCTFTNASLLSTNKTGYYVIAKSINGATPVNVFGATNGFAGTLTGAYAVSKGASGTTITIANTSGTVGTITTYQQTSTTFGHTTGLNATIANTALTAAGTCTIVSGTATDTATVFLTFTTT